MANYTLRTPRTINVDVQLNEDPDGLPPAGGQWNIASTGTFAGEFLELGSGDGPTAGPFPEGREFAVTFAPESGFDTPNAPNITAAVPTQEFVGKYVTSGTQTRDLDAEGWTLFFPTADTRQIHVSSSLGSDSTGTGSLANPYATISKGHSFMRENEADWLLLKKGDVWYESLPAVRQGKSLTEPSLVTGYGTGARPLLLTGNSAGIVSGAGAPDFWCVVGIYFYAHTRDRDSVDPNAVYADWGGVTKGGRGFNYGTGGHMQDMLIEDCVFSFYYHNRMEFSGGTTANVQIRRSVIRNTWEPSGHTSGLRAFRLRGLLDGVVFYHNGWQDAKNSGGIGTASELSHNTYIKNASDLDLIGCMFIDGASMGNKWTSGGSAVGSQEMKNVITDNCLYIGNDLMIGIGGNKTYGDRFEDCEINNCVFTTPNRLRSNDRNVGWGIRAKDWLRGSMSNNLFCHNSRDGDGAQAIWCSASMDSVTVSDTVVYNYGTKDHAMIVQPASFKATGVTYDGVIVQNPGVQAGAWSSNSNSNKSSWSVTGGQYWGSTENNGFYKIVSTETNDLSVWKAAYNDDGTEVEVSFPEPTRSIETYMTSIGETPDIDAFIQLALRQSKDTWRTDLTVPVVNNWLRAGFDMDQV